MRPPRTSSAGSQATSMTQTGHSRRRAVTSSSTATQVTEHLARFSATTPPRSYTQLIATWNIQCRSIQGPVSGVGEEIDPRDLAHPADPIAGPEVPVDVGILEREDAQEEREGQEQRDQSGIGEPDDRYRIRRDLALRRRARRRDGSFSFGFRVAGSVLGTVEDVGSLGGLKRISWIGATTVATAHGTAQSIVAQGRRTEKRQNPATPTTAERILRQRPGRSWP